MLGSKHHGTKLDFSLSAPPGLPNAFPRRAILPTACLAATLLATSFLPLAMPAHAAGPYNYWNGGTTAADGTLHGGTGNWNTTATNTNWTNATFDESAAYSQQTTAPLIFGGTAGTVTINSTGVVVGPGGLRFDTTGYTIAGSATNVLNIGAAGQQTPFNVVGAGTTATVSTAVITGGGTLVKTGAGTLILSAANTYTGGTILQDGRLQLGNASALNAAAGSLTMNGGTLGFSAAYTVATPINVAGASTIDTSTYAETLSGVISGNGDLTKIGTGLLTIGTATSTYNGNITIGAGGGLTVSGVLGGGDYSGNIQNDGTTLTFNQTANQTVSGIISGAGALTKSGTGTLTLTGHNTYTGNTTVSGGLLGIGSDDNIGPGTNTISGGGLLLTGSSYSKNWALGTGTDTINTAIDTTFSGILSGAATTFTKAGTGNLTLAGNNTYTGATTVSAGTLTFTGTNAYVGATTINAGATMAVLAGGGLGPGNSYSGAITDNGTLLLNQDNAQTLTGAISGSGTLTKQGANTLTLGAGTTTYSYTPLIDVQAGTVALAGTGAKTFTWLALHDGGIFDATGAGTATVTVNRLDVYSGAVWNGNLTMGTGKTMNFYIPSDLEEGQALLTVHNGNVNIQGETITWGFQGNALHLYDQITLIDVNGGTLTGTPGSFTGREGATLFYTMNVDLIYGESTNQLVATVSSLRDTSESKFLPEAYITGAALINQSGDLVAGNGLMEAMAVAGSGGKPGAVKQGGYGFGVFGAVSGGQNLYNTGSSTDLSSVSLMAGVAMGNNLAPGRLTVGAFVEYGNGSYDTYNSFNGIDMGGSGDIDHIGGGILARMDFNQTESGTFYLEASARAGSVSNDYKNADMGGFAVNFKSDAAYYGVHGGLGYAWILTEKAGLDLYGKYFWTRQDGSTATLNYTGVDFSDPIVFGDVSSDRLRLGGRFTYAVNNMIVPYVGAAYEHEFDGKEQATTHDIPINAPTLQGGTMIGELGLALKSTKNLPLTLDVGVQGYAGIRQGVTGSLQVKYDF